MARIKDEKQYKAALHRIDELLKVCSNETPATDKNMLELDLISDLVAVAVPGEVGAVLPEAGIVAPGAHICLVGKRCCDANHCHQKCEKYTFLCHRKSCQHFS